jgi:hypothetical protein
MVIVSLNLARETSGGWEGERKISHAVETSGGWERERKISRVVISRVIRSRTHQRQKRFFYMGICRIVSKLSSTMEICRIVSK